MHCVLWEIVSFPDGLIGRAGGPFPGSFNDRNAVEHSRIREVVAEHFHGHCLYGDSIYYNYEPEVSHRLAVSWYRM